MLNSSITVEGIRPLTPPERMIWEWFFDIHHNLIEQMSYDPAVYTAEQRFTASLRGGLVNRAYRNRIRFHRRCGLVESPNEGMQSIMELGRCVQAYEAPPSRPATRL